MNHTSHFSRGSNGAAFYNELDPYASAWLRNLESAGHIARGEVDDRDVRQVEAAAIAAFTQCHFFAGIGVWSYALRLAGWPDDAPVWTGSCPCQPFSQAGKRGGFDDERHLWPEWFRLIRELGPPVVFGEQVASPDGLEWFDAVSTDMEAAGYAVGAADLCAAGVGAPHARQRLFFVALACGERREGLRLRLLAGRSRSSGAEARGHGQAGSLADIEGVRRAKGLAPLGVAVERKDGTARDVGDADSSRGGRNSRGVPRQEAESGGIRLEARDIAHEPLFANATRGFWAGADWLYHRDEKWRPVEPGTFPLADGAPTRVGRLRAYGNAISPQVAAEFIGAVTEVLCAA